MAIINHTVVFITEHLGYIITLSIIDVRKGNEKIIFKKSLRLALMIDY